MLTSLVSVLIAVVSATSVYGAEQKFQPAKDEFTAVGQAVVELLQRRDTAKFASRLVASVDDWKSVLSTNLPSNDEDPAKGFPDTVSRERKTVEASAKALLSKADALKLDFSRGELSFR